MADGPGKYDHLATLVREAANADGVAVLVINGNLGSGFSVQVDEGLHLALPSLLRTIADSLDAENLSH